MQATTNAGPRSHSTAVLVIILASYFMIVLDISIVITALPKIHHGLISTLLAVCVAKHIARFFCFSFYFLILPAWLAGYAIRMVFPA